MSRFFTVELSDPRLERPGLRVATVKSPALRRRADVTFFVPPGRGSARDLPLVILLHGIYGSHWAWALKGGAHRTAQDLIDRKAIRPIVLAMPSDGLWGDGSGYVPHADADYEAWILDDVPALAREAVPQVRRSRALFLSGLSMGGYGAMRLGAKYADRVRGISAHSSGTDLRHMRPYVEEVPRPRRGSGPTDVLSWILKNRRRLPPLRFDCGVDDELLVHNRALHRALSEHGIEHRYEEFPGGHTWAYWTKHLRDSLLFFEECLER